MSGLILFHGCSNLLFKVSKSFYELSSLHDIFFEFAGQPIVLTVKPDNFNFKMRLVVRQ